MGVLPACLAQRLAPLLACTAHAENATCLGAYLLNVIDPLTRKPLGNDRLVPEMRCGLGVRPAILLLCSCPAQPPQSPQALLCAETHVNTTCHQMGMPGLLGLC